MTGSRGTSSRGARRANPIAERTSSSSGHGGEGRPRRFAGAASVLLTGGLVLAGCSTESAPGPAEVLAEYAEARNARDFEAMRALYADDAVIVGHQNDSDGIADVDWMMAFEEWLPVGETRFVDVEISGDQATFNDHFRGGYIDSSLVVQVTVVDGEITDWTYVHPDDHG